MKLKWFEQKQWEDTEISAIEKTVRDRWVQDYASEMMSPILDVPRSKVSSSPWTPSILADRNSGKTKVLVSELGFRHRRT